MQPDKPIDQSHFGGRREDRLVGREAELGSILVALESASHGTGRVLLLSGEPGVGKTRLARDALARAVSVGFDTLIGHCREQYQAIPCFGLAEALTDRPAAARPSDKSAPVSDWPDLSFLMLPQHSPSGAEGGSPLPMFRAVTNCLRGIAAD